MVNRAGASASVAVNVEADAMTEYKLSFSQMSSSLVADGSFRFFVTGLVGAAANCSLTVAQAAVWVVLTDTSGIGDGYTFKVTAKP